MILFLVNKQIMISDLVINSGISPRNFWFEYFMQKFSSYIIPIDSFEELIITLQFDKDIEKSKLIIHLNEHDIDGKYFDNMKIFALEKSIFNMDFTKIKSRKIKTVEV